MGCGRASLVRGGGEHLPQVLVSTVKLTPKAVAVTSNGRRVVIPKPLFSEAVGKRYSLITIMALKTGYGRIIITTIRI